MKKPHTKIPSGSLKGRVYLGDQGVEGGIILK